MLKKIIIYCLLISISPAYAMIDADKGDVVIFNTPNQKYLSFQMKLLTCIEPNHCTALSTSSLIDSQNFYVFTLKKWGNQTKGKAIYAAFLAKDAHEWTPPQIIIEQYDPSEDPFYQLVCWYPPASTPTCSNGLDDKMIPD